MPSSSASPERVPAPPHAARGRHAYGDLHECERLVHLNGRTKCLRRDLEAFCRARGATVVDVFGADFEPQGCTVVAILAESHATIHTYPEHGTVFVDVFTCGDRVDPLEIVKDLAIYFGSKIPRMGRILRGEKWRLAT